MMDIVSTQRYAGCLRRHCDDMEAMARAGDGCDPKPEKIVAGGTPEGDICRLLARASYLGDLLMCELTSDDPEKCCAKAYRDYCRAVDACPR